jgi:hypothetical protein
VKVIGRRRLKRPLRKATSVRKLFAGPDVGQPRFELVGPLLLHQGAHLPGLPGLLILAPGFALLADFALEDASVCIHAQPVDRRAGRQWKAVDGLLPGRPRVVEALGHRDAGGQSRHRGADFSVQGQGTAAARDIAFDTPESLLVISAQRFDAHDQQQHQQRGQQQQCAVRPAERLVRPGSAAVGVVLREAGVPAPQVLFELLADGWRPGHVRTPRSWSR